MKLLLLVLIPVAMLVGCSAAPKAELDPRAIPVFGGKDGKTVAWKDLVTAASGAEAALLGENHGHPVGLPVAAALWEDVVKQSPHAGLAMEFFYRDQQGAIDDYLSGITDDAGFGKATGRTATSYPNGHRAMIEAAKSAKRPVVAANVPWRYLRIASKEGYDRLTGLTPEQKRMYRIPDELPTGKYRTAFDEVMGGGEADLAKMTPEKAAEKRKGLDNGFRSQSLWDWTMAESVARTIDRGATPTMLVIGRFHIDHEGGTVLALRKLRPGTRVVTVSFVNETSASLREEDRGRADFVIYTGPSPEEK